ncbi:MAG: outer membrane lipoprotein carrier protein LolA, partial [Candidatus Cloacimonetes bacterium]|nr:outer membrane lipoprotein carrier protein LolA [Candidatus Cloacimonadota bacterium]
MKKINLILLLLLGVLYAQSVPQLHQRVQNQYQNLSSFQAEVEQSNYFAQLKRSIVFKGKIYFSPQRMLMHFSNPSVQRLQINAGKV